MTLRDSLALTLKEPLYYLLCLGTGGFVFWLYGVPGLWLFGPLLIILCALCVIDLKHQLLPNALVALLGGVGLAYTLWSSAVLNYGGVSINLVFDLLWQVLLAVVGGGVMWTLGALGSRMAGREALGLGDVKLVAALCLWPWMTVNTYILMLLLASLLAMPWALHSIWQRRQQGQPGQYLAFGPYLMAGATLAMLFQNQLWALLSNLLH